MKNWKDSYDGVGEFSILEKTLIYEILRIDRIIKKRYTNKLSDINLEKITKNINRNFDTLSNKMEEDKNNWDDTIEYEDDGDETEDTDEENIIVRTKSATNKPNNASGKSKKKTNKEARSFKGTHEAYTTELRQKFGDKLENICINHNISSDDINKTFKKITEIKEGKNKNHKFNNQEKAILIEIARTKIKGRQTANLGLARFYVSVILEKEREEIRDLELKKRKRRPDADQEEQQATTTNQQDKQDNTTKKTRQDELEHSQTETRNNRQQSQQLRQSQHDNINTTPISTYNNLQHNMSSQIDYANKIGSIIIASGKNLHKYLHEDEIVTRDKIHEELYGSLVMDFKHASIYKKGTKYEIRIITNTKEATDRIISQQSIAFGGLEIISCQSTQNRLLMKATLPRNMNKEIDAKEMDQLRSKYGVLNFEQMQTTGANKKLKIEFCSKEKFYEAFIKGIFIGNDRINCIPCWKLIPFCIKCTTWEHESNECNTNKFTCFKCSEEHDGLKCTENNVFMCKCCQGDHLGYDSICELYRVKFNEKNSFIINLLKEEQSKLSSQPLNIIIPKNNHISYGIRNIGKTGNTANLPKNIENRLQELENFKTQQIAENSKLNEKITNEVTKQIDSLRTEIKTEITNDGNATRQMLMQQIEADRNLKQILLSKIENNQNLNVNSIPLNLNHQSQYYYNNTGTHVPTFGQTSTPNMDTNQQRRPDA